MTETKVMMKRVYAEPGHEDGMRILVDRLWPRDLSKAKAKVDLWLKDLAPSTELRKWFGHDPDKWPEFKKRYAQELKSHSEQLALLKQYVDQGPITLLYGARDEQHNEAIILQKLLQRK